MELSAEDLSLGAWLSACGLPATLEEQLVGLGVEAPHDATFLEDEDMESLQLSAELSAELETAIGRLKAGDYVVNVHVGHSAATRAAHAAAPTAAHTSTVDSAGAALALRAAEDKLAALKLQHDELLASHKAAMAAVESAEAQARAQTHIAARLPSPAACVIPITHFLPSPPPSGFAILFAVCLTRFPSSVREITRGWFWCQSSDDNSVFRLDVRVLVGCAGWQGQGGTGPRDQGRRARRAAGGGACGQAECRARAAPAHEHRCCACRGGAHRGRPDWRRAACRDWLQRRIRRLAGRERVLARVPRRRRLHYCRAGPSQPSFTAAWCTVHIAQCRLPTAHCRLQTADRRPQTADRRLRAGALGRQRDGSLSLLKTLSYCSRILFRRMTPTAETHNN